MRMFKETGVEWIGEIPQDWQVAQVRYLFNIGRGRVIAQTELVDDGMYPVFSSQTKNNGCLGYINTYDYECEQLTWTTDGANAGTVFLRKGRHNCTNVCGTLMAMKDNICLRYQKYALEHIAFYHKRLDTNGFKIMNNEMAAIKTMLPSMDEQERIANYLDSKCYRIDSIIEKQQAVIEKLKEYKLSVMNEVVANSKGIKCYLSNIGNFKNGLNFISGNTTVVKFLGVGDFKDYYILNKKEMFSDIMLDGFVTDDYLLQNNDFVFVRSNGSKDIVGRCVMVKNINFPLTYSGFCIRFRNNREDIALNEYLLLIFRSPFFREQIEKYSRGSNINKLNQAILSEIPICLPPKHEQEKIVNDITIKFKKIANVLERKKDIVEKLIEYKKSLIYEVVTGKKEV